MANPLATILVAEDLELELALELVVAPIIAQTKILAEKEILTTQPTTTIRSKLCRKAFQ
jgi:hypothetical protein